MKKIITLSLILALVCSCKYIDQKEETEETKNAAMAVDSVVNDKDENGCLASAGYVWSKVNKECVKGFSGIQLNPLDKPNNDDETLSAYLLFNEDATLAEVFLPKDTTSIVLTQKKQEGTWDLDEWKLIHDKGYILKKGNETKFAGDDQIGPKEINSDTEEQ